MNPPPDTTEHDTRTRIRAALVSIIVGVLLLCVKYVAYRMTGSTAILSDALESVVNVAAAVFSFAAVVFAGHPADKNHPYGHGKIEFFSAVFEGGLIAFAALLIFYTAVGALVTSVRLQTLDAGMAITFGAGAANAVLGLYLIRIGEKHHSPALVADGKHVMSDFWTSFGIVVALALVRITGRAWFDPLVACIVGLHLAWTGVLLIRHAAGGLLDEQDMDLLEDIVQAFNERVEPGIIRIHFLRAIRLGHFKHIDAHIVVPEFWSVQEAHDHTDRFEARVVEILPFDAEIVFHTDPCRRAFCAVCDFPSCADRARPFEQREPMTLEEALHTDEEMVAWLDTKQGRWGLIPVLTPPTH